MLKASGLRTLGSVSLINQAVVALGLSLGLFIAHRSWLIHAESQDLSSFHKHGDELVQIADEGWAGGFGSINVVCRDGRANHLLAFWRIPCRSDPGGCNYPKKVDRFWPSTGTTDQPGGSKKSLPHSVSLIFEAEDAAVRLAPVKLSDMSIGRREHGEIFISKQLGKQTIDDFIDRMVKSTGRFTINVGEQSEWFYLRHLANTPERFKQVCRRD